MKSKGIAFEEENTAEDKEGPTNNRYIQVTTG
jgi:hypothetical protein